MKQVISVLQEWSIPLIAGVFAALLMANMAPTTYHALVDAPFPEWNEQLNHAVEADMYHGAPSRSPAEDAGASHADKHESTHTHAAVTAADPHEPDAHGGHDGPWWYHYLTLHFLINDIFMVFFFGIATKEIVEACLPRGALNPPSKAINPLLGTIGGVLGPIGVFLALNLAIGQAEWVRGWGIPTATDIALAWLVARIIFGAGHPAISFLLLLAVADDAIGLGIIAFGYPDPQHPTVWTNTLWILPGMALAFLFRRMGVQNWMPYIFVGGAFSWWGLYSAHLHPALALVPIVPFLPARAYDVGLFAEEADYAEHAHHPPLEAFEHQLKLFVDFGLFFFAFANAGVQFAAMSTLTWIVFFALLLGKIVGIFGFSALGAKLGAPLPNGMGLRDLFVASMVAAIGLTVALFVAGQAFAPGTATQSAAKMGALFSGGIAVLAIVTGMALRVRNGHLGDIPADTDVAVTPPGEPDTAGKIRAA